MALVHEFGIIDTFSAASFEDYSPEKYQCISVNDAHIQVLLQSLSLIKTYFHSSDRPEFGLAYYGTTIIPPESFAAFLEVVLSAKKINQQEDIIELSQLILQAKKENKYMIHYGI